MFCDYVLISAKNLSMLKQFVKAIHASESYTHYSLSENGIIDSAEI